jgi:glycine/D-amino acid oxidase-like deaminating enzyme
VISTEKGEIRCEYVVNAAGYYAQRSRRRFKFGGDVPMMVMSHQYMLFDEVPEVARLDRRSRSQAAADARCRQFLLSPAGKERLQPRPL